MVYSLPHLYFPAAVWSTVPLPISSVLLQADAYFLVQPLTYPFYLHTSPTSAPRTADPVQTLQSQTTESFSVAKTLIPPGCHSGSPHLPSLNSFWILTQFLESIPNRHANFPSLYQDPPEIGSAWPKVPTRQNRYLHIHHKDAPGIDRGIT